MTPDALHKAMHDLLREVTQKAILPRYQKLATHEVTAKAADDVVTVADHESEALLAEGLASIMDMAKREGVMAGIGDHYRLVDVPWCAAEQYPRLALGVNDLSIFERTLPWDHAAGALWLNEAGGKCARLDGSPYRMDEWDRRGLLGAASPELWDQMAERLSALPD